MYQYLHQQTVPYYDMTGQREPDMALLDSMTECIIRSRFSTNSADMLTTMLVDRLMQHIDTPVNLDFPYGFEIERYYSIQDLANHLGKDSGLRRLTRELIPDRFYDEHDGMGLIVHNHGYCIWTIIGKEHFSF